MDKLHILVRKIFIYIELHLVLTDAVKNCRKIKYWCMFSFLCETLCSCAYKREKKEETFCCTKRINAATNTNISPLDVKINSKKTKQLNTIKNLIKPATLTVRYTSCLHNLPQRRKNSF